MARRRRLTLLGVEVSRSTSWRESVSDQAPELRHSALVPEQGRASRRSGIGRPGYVLVAVAVSGRDASCGEGAARTVKNCMIRPAATRKVFSVDCCTSTSSGRPHAPVAAVCLAVVRRALSLESSGLYVTSSFTRQEARGSGRFQDRPRVRTEVGGARLDSSFNAIVLTLAGLVSRNSCAQERSEMCSGAST
jgi:hypothetical protein